MQRKQSEAVLARAEPVVMRAGVRYEEEILIGPIGRVPAECARALGCDAIVVGTHGLTALGSLLVG